MNVTLTKHALKSLDQRVREQEGWHEQDPRPLILGTERLIAYFGFALLFVLCLIVFKAVV